MHARRLRRCSRLRFLRSLGLAAVAAAAAAIAAAQAPSLPDATPLSLEASIRLALASSPTLEQAAARVEHARARLDEVRGKRWPTLSFNANFGLVPGAEGDIFDSPDTDTGSLADLGPFLRSDLTLVQPLLTFGKLSAGQRAARGGIRAAEEQARIDRAKLALDVSRLYYLTLAARELSELADEAEERLAKALSKAQEIFEQASGQVTQQDMAKLRIFNAKLASQALAARTGVELSRAALTLAVGLPDASTLRLPDERLRAPAEELPGLEPYREQALSRRPELEALRAGIAARQALVEVERKRFLPDLFLAAQIRYAVAPNRTDQTNPFVKDDFNFFNYGAAFGMRLELPLKQELARIRMARAELAQLQSQYEQAAQGIGLEVEKEYREAIEARERVRITRDGLRAARGWMVSETQLYQTGTGETRNVLEALGAYAEAKKDSIDALQRYHISLAELRRAAGVEPLAATADQATDRSIQPPPSTSSPR
jgi:outer membrane protein